jgi:hypothetical protein
MPTPKAFVSYSWDDETHKAWVKALAARLRADGVNLTLDQWAVVPGDQLPRFMDTSVRENDFVLIVCTPNYKRKSDNRQGGAGYEGDIIRGEIFTGENDRKFIPVLRAGDWRSSTPSSLKGKCGLDFRGEPYREESYEDLLSTLHGTREQAPPIGVPPQTNTTRHARRSTSRALSTEAAAILSAAAKVDRRIFEIETDDGLKIVAGDAKFDEPGNPLSHATNLDNINALIAARYVERDSNSSLTVTPEGIAYLKTIEPLQAADRGTDPFRFEPIRIIGIIANEVGTPRDDGTQGSALYAVPFQLSRQPTSQWADHFVETWRRPPSYSTRHRPGIARVVGDRIILDGTTVDEVTEIHRETLKVVVAKVNQDIEEWERRRWNAAQQEAERLRQHRQAVNEAAKRISFD